MPRQISEDATRKKLIDPQLEKAGWYLRDHSKVKIEIPVDGYDAEPRNGVSDYCLYRENGDVLAVVEAKKTCVDVRLAEGQLTHYVTEIEQHQSFRPFGFLANGLEIHFVIDRSYQHNYNADQIRFLRAVQSVFLQKRHLETADLYEPPLDMFGADAVERLFTKEDISEMVEFSKQLTIIVKESKMNNS